LWQPSFLQPAPLRSLSPQRSSIDSPKSAAILEPDEASVSLFAEDDLAATASGAIFSSDLALVSSVSRQVELARTPLGAKKVAKSILLNEYGFSEKEYKCLNSLWTKESHWNYKARNKNSGAHGIAQALPASKMNVVSTDWRIKPSYTNPLGPSLYQYPL